ncbi:MAG TPA: hypothetical protein EYG57_12190 [Planctomycetes bacterium]|nr:hypothetical protein [Planctomycetaceae bacterium]HIM30288.1 hypothetical protein [Planctomycetota bacterium]
MLTGKSKKVPEVCKTLDISEQTYYRWRQKYEGAKPRCVYLAQPSGLGLVGVWGSDARVICRCSTGTCRCVDKACRQQRSGWR